MLDSLFVYPDATATIAPRAPSTRRTMSKVLIVWEDELDDDTIEGTRKMIALLERTLAAERERGIAAHWAYDRPRHEAIMQIYNEEVERLKGAGCFPA